MKRLALIALLAGVGLALDGAEVMARGGGGGGGRGGSSGGGGRSSGGGRSFSAGGGHSAKPAYRPAAASRPSVRPASRPQGINGRAAKPTFRPQMTTRRGLTPSTQPQFSKRPGSNHHLTNGRKSHIGIAHHGGNHHHRHHGRNHHHWHHGRNHRHWAHSTWNCPAIDCPCDDPATDQVEEDSAMEPEQDSTYGMQIQALGEGTASDEGMKLGDIIVRVNGQDTPDFDVLRDALEAAGSQADVDFVNVDNGQLERVRLYPENTSLGVTVEQVRIE